MKIKKINKANQAMAKATEIYYLTIIRPNGDVVEHINTKDELCEAIQSALGGEFEHIAMSKLVVKDVVMRERIKGRRVYVLETSRGQPNNDYFGIKGGYYKDGFPEFMTEELHKKWWVKTTNKVQGTLVAVSKKRPYTVPVANE